MRSMLSDLNKGVPVMGSKLFSTIITLSIFLNKLHNLSLLHLSCLINISDKVYLYPHAFAMRLSPDKLGLFDLTLP